MEKASETLPPRKFRGAVSPIDSQSITPFYPLIYADIFDASSPVQARGTQVEGLGRFQILVNLSYSMSTYSFAISTGTKNHPPSSAQALELPFVETSKTCGAPWQMSNQEWKPPLLLQRNHISEPVMGLRESRLGRPWETWSTGGRGEVMATPDSAPGTRALKLGNKKHVPRLQLSQQAGDFHPDLPTPER